MPRKIQPSEEISKEINELLMKGLEEEIKTRGNVISRLMQLSFLRLVQQSLEEEQKDWLGREWGIRGKDRRGYRNGYEERQIKTAEGKLKVKVPQVRDSEEKYRSRIMENIGNMSEMLQKLALECYVRGLSVRDIEETFIDSNGERLLSKDAVTELSESLWEEYEKFKSKDLSEYDVVYLFVDGVYESLRREAKCKEAVFVAWAILSDGRKVLLSMGIGNKESTENWKEFFYDMIKRNLRQPLLVISDGAPGLIRAVEEVFKMSKRQRCIVHKLRNIANKLPKKIVDEIMLDFKAIFYAPTKEQAKKQIEYVIDKYSDKYPSAVNCMLDDIEACLTFYDFPAVHHRYIRTTNLLERTFVEEKRRTKIIPQFLNERSCLKLVFAILIRVSKKWRKIKMSPLELTVLRNIRKLLTQNKEDSNMISFEFSKSA